MFIKYIYSLRKVVAGITVCQPSIYIIWGKEIDQGKELQIDFYACEDILTETPIKDIDFNDFADKIGKYLSKIYQ